MLGDKIGKSHHGLGQHHILRIAHALVEEFMHGNPRHALHFQFRHPIAVKRVHPGDEKRYIKPRITGCGGQRFEFAKIGTRTGDEKDGFGHGSPYLGHAGRP